MTTIGEELYPALLGRREQFDDRSRNYPVRLGGAAERAKPRSYTWRRPQLHLDQGLILDTWWKAGGCTGYSTANVIGARPRAHPVTNELGASLYKRAQERWDEWEGEDYEGSSVLAAAKAAREAGLVTGFRWGFGLADVVWGIGNDSPCVFGLPWTEGMFHPDGEGFIRPTGQVMGGHAIAGIGVNHREKWVGLLQSWWPTWGQGGMCRIRFDHLDQLLHQRGEALFLDKVPVS